ncbi:MAG: NADH-quinone oxidoreductase subunit J [Candidatus Zixiibacteriota bacterium]
MEATTLDIVVFYLAAAGAVGGAFMMIWQRNPVASALFLILSLVSQAVLYIMLDAVFVGALLVIIYAGAIVTLFLFVIMLLNLRGEQFVDQSVGVRRYLKLLIAGLVGAELVYIVAKTSPVKLAFTELVGPLATFGDINPVAELLYSKYLYGFELTSILLLVAIVGAVILALREVKSEAGADSSE